jgi:hypothetical protein
MNSKERMMVLFNSGISDVYPAVAPYTMLSNVDHWTDFTGKPVYEYYRWLWEKPYEHVKMYDHFNTLVPFDWMEPYPVPDRHTREVMEISFKNGIPWIHNKETGECTPVPVSIHTANGPANETRKIMSINEIAPNIKILSAQECMNNGEGDMLIAFSERYGTEHFIVIGGVVNTFFSCSYYLGMTNLFSLLVDEPEFVLELEKRLLEKNIETIRLLAMSGGDAIYIDDATATCDMISLEYFEKFSLPFLHEQIKEIKRLGKKVILIFFGGIEDRLEQILSTGLDGLIIETSMKGYVNDVGLAAKKSRGDCVIFGNINPIEFERQSQDWIYSEIEKQACAVRPFAPFAVSTGSPITPGTSVRRMGEFINAAHSFKY